MADASVLNLEGMALHLLGCAQAQLAATPGGSPERAGVVPGAQIAWDDCECAQLTVHIPQVYPSKTFPAPKQEPPWGRCTSPLMVAEYVVTILRCVPVQDDAGNPPSIADLEAAAMLDLADRAAVLRAVSCCLSDLERGLPRFMLMQQQLAVGGEGMCAGSETHVFVGLPACWSNCPEPEDA